MAKRTYLVEDGEKQFLIKATTKASAIKHAAGQKFTASVATQDQLVELVKKGVEVVEAGNTAKAE